MNSSNCGNIFRKMSTIAKKFVLSSKIIGSPKLTDFKLIEEPLANNLQDGEILAKAEWLTVDPYMRARSVDLMKIGDQFLGGQVAQVVQSKCNEFPEGTHVVSYFGWRDLTIYKPEPNGPRNRFTIYKTPDTKGLPLSYCLGSLGMPGMTAYFSVTEILKPKPGQTFVVSAAAGAVGSLAGQVGKLKGCKVIGFAGNEEKLKWLTEELGFDMAFNYKNADIDAILKKHVPEGVDLYLDNVGGEFAFHVINNMNQFGKIAQCGSISTYNVVEDKSKIPSEPFSYKDFRVKNLSLLGFNVGRWSNSPVYFEGINQMRDWILEGKIKVRETVTEGFANMPKAFIELLEGKNIGKQIIKA